MNAEALRTALAKHNINHVSEATRIAPHTLERIVDGKYLPNPEEADALAAWFAGEFSMSGIDQTWARKPKEKVDPDPLPQVSSRIDPKALPQREFSPWAPISEYPDRPTLKPGPAPKGTGAVGDGITGQGMRVR